jgi:hypothetical protein
MPVIESKIDVQLSELVSNTPALSAFPIGGRERAQVSGTTPPYRGKVWYQTRKADKDAELVVFWVGDSNACRIVKVELQGTDFNDQIIWQK